MFKPFRFKIIFILFSIGIIWGSLWKIKDQRGQTLPFKVSTNYAVNSLEYKKIAEAIDYINLSVKQEVFSLTAGSGRLQVFSYKEKKFKECQTSLALYHTWSHSITICPQYLESQFEDMSKIALAHELIHSLGIPHDYTEFSLMNVGEKILNNKNTSEFKSLQLAMPPKDVQRVQRVLSALPKNNFLIIDGGIITIGGDSNAFQGFILKY